MNLNWALILVPSQPVRLNETWTQATEIIVSSEYFETKAQPQPPAGGGHAEHDVFGMK